MTIKHVAQNSLGGFLSTNKCVSPYDPILTYWNVLGDADIFDNAKAAEDAATKSGSKSYHIRKVKLTLLEDAA